MDRPNTSTPSAKELLTFIHSKQFDAAWKELGLTEENLMELQWQIILRPSDHPVVRGTDGLRKMRFAPQGAGRGQRGSYRVCYVYFAEHEVVYLVIVFAKNRSGNLPEAAKKAVRQLIAEIRRYLSSQER